MIQLKTSKIVLSTFLKVEKMRYCSHFILKFKRISISILRPKLGTSMTLIKSTGKKTQPHLISIASFYQNLAKNLWTKETRNGDKMAFLKHLISGKFLKSSRKRIPNGTKNSKDKILVFINLDGITFLRHAWKENACFK